MYNSAFIDWLAVLGLTVLLDNYSVYIGPSPREREKEEKKAYIDCQPFYKLNYPLISQMYLYEL